MVVMVVEVLYSYSREVNEVLYELCHTSNLSHSLFSLTHIHSINQSINQSSFLYRIVKSIIYIHVHNVYIF